MCSTGTAGRGISTVEVIQGDAIDSKLDNNLLKAARAYSGSVFLATRFGLADGELMKISSRFPVFLNPCRKRAQGKREDHERGIGLRFARAPLRNQLFVIAVGVDGVLDGTPGLANGTRGLQKRVNHQPSG
jgi:hypothetical protein